MLGWYDKILFKALNVSLHEAKSRIMKENITEKSSFISTAEASGLVNELKSVPKAPEPAATLSLTDAIALIVGIVIGAGIFRTPSLVAANSESDTMFLIAWLAGGVVSLVGALCY